MNEAYTRMKDRFAASAFRSRFRLNDDDRRYLAAKGWNVIRSQARRIIRERLAPACPENDGRQTPMRGHPVFVGQHATGCCCRGCLYRWHHIAPGHTLTQAEQQYAVSVLMAWIERQLQRNPQ